MRVKVFFSLALMVVVGVLLAGCGGSSDSSSGGGGGNTGGTETTAADGTTPAESTEAGDGSSEQEDGGEAEGGDGTEGEDGNEAEKEKPLSKTEFNTRVNEICIQVPPGYEEELKKLEKELGKKKPTKAETNLKAAIPPLESALESMEFLTPPDGEEQKMEETITALQNAISGLEEKPTSELSGPQSPFAEFQEVTKKNGFETCSGL